MHIVIDARIRRSSTGRYTARLLDHLQRMDTTNRYTILLQPDDPWRPEVANFSVVACKYAQFSFNPTEQFGFAWQLYRLKPDLVHFTMTQQPLLYFGNIVTTTHDLTMFRFVRRGTTPMPLFAIKMWIYKVMFVWSHWKSKAIIVPTNYVAKDLAQYQPSTKSKIVVTYEASEPMHAKKAIRPEQVQPKDRFIMYLGTAFPHKNLYKLVDAFAIIKKTQPDIKLILVGKKEIHYDELAEYVGKQKNRDDIYITGFLPDEEARWLYEHCTAYVFPSLSEGFGLSGLEAMMHGAPVVSSNATCLPEVHGDACEYFDPLSVEDMASKIASVIDDETKRGNLIEKGYVQAGKFSWSRMAQQTLEVYEKALSGRK